MLKWILFPFNILLFPSICPRVIKDIWISPLTKFKTQSIPSGTHRRKYSTYSLSPIKRLGNYNIASGGISLAWCLFISEICIAFDHELFRGAFLLIKVSVFKSEWLKGNTERKATMNCGGEKQVVAPTGLLTVHPDDVFVISINWLGISSSRSSELVS